MGSDRDVVLAYVDCFNRGDLEGLCRLFAPDAQIWGVLGFGGLEVARPVWKDLMECLQLHLQVEGLVADGGVVAVRYKESGTAIKPFRGQPATGKTYELLAMEWFEVKDGLISRRWGARDSASMARQIGWQ
jgi:steroid delta-isomerase-like uncharacterized protein